MNLIDRYVYAATERLSEDTREDVSRELRANIEDMLPETPTESDIYEVLQGLGNPMKMADEYNQRKRYLIGPGIYDSYLSVLKLVLGIVAIVFVCITLLEWAVNPPVSGKFSQIYIQFFLDIMFAPIQGMLQGFLWVTVVFIILERSGITEGKMPFIKKKWSPGDLPAIPASKKRRISRVETVFSIFCTIFFTAIVYFQSGLIGLYTKGENGLYIVSPLFVKERIGFYISIILIFAFIQFSILIWKFISRKWTFPLAIVNVINNTALSVFICVMLSDSSLFNQGLLAKIAVYANTSNIETIRIWLRDSLWISAVIFVAISIFDSVIGFVKCKR